MKQIQNKKNDRNLDNLLNDMSILSHDPDPFGLITSVIHEEPLPTSSPRNQRVNANITPMTFGHHREPYAPQPILIKEKSNQRSKSKNTLKVKFTEDDEETLDIVQPLGNSLKTKVGLPQFLLSEFSGAKTLPLVRQSSQSR